jgi:hypothetical protein
MINMKVCDSSAISSEIIMYTCHVCKKMQMTQSKVFETALYCLSCRRIQPPINVMRISVDERVKFHVRNKS